jgi:gamma-glutamyltranspeptidase/glutathione hydrolase
MTHGQISHPFARSARAAHAALLALVVLIAACAQSCASVAPQEKPERVAAVAISDRFGADAAQAVLTHGGNAVDAAIAVAFVLAVTYPEAGNLGGGGFMLIYDHGKPAFLDYRETAPAAASRDMYLDKDGNVIKGASHVGYLASGVPGTVAGLWAAHERYGSVPWKNLLAPAIALARDGFEPSEQMAKRVWEDLAGYEDRTNMARYYGKVKGGERFVQPELAQTLERIAEKGADEFYKGRTAELIAAEMKRGGGLITQADLAGYRAIWREPLAVNWRDYRLLAAPLPSSGGFGLIQLLEMKDDLAQQFAGVAHNSTRYVHLVAEMEKRVFADRAEYLGDPDFVDAPIAKLIDPAYIARRAAEVQPDRISTIESVRPGLEESVSTTHFSIMDAQGNAVANTYTLNGWYGSGVVVEGAGFLMNNEMDDFSIKHGVPNYYGVVGGNANEIQPGKRMLSSMSPTILLRGDDVAMVLGTPGGSTIFTSVFQTMVNILDFGMTPQQAVAATRFHHQLLPPTDIRYSPCCSLPSDTIEGLRKLGYAPRPNGWEFGDLEVIWVDPQGHVTAASDPRGRGDSRVFAAGAEAVATQ